MKLLHKINHWILIVSPYILIVAFAFFLLFRQIQAHAFIAGSDTMFHMNRFYDTAMQIKTGRYNYFLSWFGFNRIGHVVNPLYGPGFAYLMGLLLLITGSWVKWEITVSVSLLIIAGFGMYYLCRDNQIRRLVSLVMAIIYMASPIGMLFPINSSFTGVGAAFTPLVFMMGCRMVRNDSVPFVKLGILMAVLAQIHVLSTIFSCIILLCFYVMAWLRSHHKLILIKQLFAAIVTTLALTINVWSGMLQVMTQNSIISPFPNLNLNRTGDFSIGFDSGFKNIGWPVMIILVIMVLLFLARSNQVSPITKFTVMFSVFMFWASSEYFPWLNFANRFRFLYYDFQSAARLLPIALVSLLLGLGLLMKSIDQYRIIKYLLLVLLICGIVILSQNSLNAISAGVHRFNVKNGRVFTNRAAYYHIKNSKRFHESFNNHNLALPILSADKISPDYLPGSSSVVNGSYYKLEQVIQTKSKLRPKYQFESKNRMQIKWRSKNSKRQLFPIIKYRSTQLTLNHHRIYPKLNQIDAITIKPRIGVNNLTVHYREPPLFNVQLWLTMIRWFSLVGWMIEKLIKHLKIKHAS